MYEIGDIVRVRPDLNVELHRGVVGGMMPIAGEIVTIKTVRDGERFRMYTLKEDPWEFIWADWMFEREELPLDISMEDMETLL